MLKTKQVDKYTVSQFGTLASVRARYFSEEVIHLRKEPAKGATLSQDDEIYNTWLDGWVTIASMVQPKITLAEYESMGVEFLTELNQALDEVNSDGSEDAQAQPVTTAQAKKKRMSKT